MVWAYCLECMEKKGINFKTTVGLPTPSVYCLRLKRFRSAHVYWKKLEHDMLVVKHPTMAVNNSSFTSSPELVVCVCKYVNSSSILLLLFIQALSLLPDNHISSYYFVISGGKNQLQDMDLKMNLK